MSDLILDEIIEYASGSYLSTGAVIFLPNSIEINEEVNYGNSYLASGLIVFTLQSILVDEDIRFGSFFQSSIGSGFLHIFTPGILINEIVLPFVNGDNTSRIVYEVTVAVPPIVPVYPTSGLKIEILYPIIPLPNSNVEIHKTDSGEYKRVIKPSDNKIYSTLKFRIHSSSLNEFLQFIYTNRSSIVNLLTPAIYPFGNRYLNSYVYIVSYTKPQLEKAQYWRMDVTFLQIVGIS